jgi:hypothetical protein
MSESWMAALGAVIAENRWAPQRLAGLRAAERKVYGSVLRSFVDDCVPDAAWFRGRRDEVERLVERDLLGVDRDGAVVVAYPFSARPTRHRVRTERGRRPPCGRRRSAQRMSAPGDHSAAWYGGAPPTWRRIT